MQDQNGVILWITLFLYHFSGKFSKKCEVLNKHPAKPTNTLYQDRKLIVIVFHLESCYCENIFNNCSNTLYISFQS